MVHAATATLGLLVVLALASCAPAPAGPEGEPSSGTPARATTRARDPGLEEVRAALERYRGERALALLERVQGFEAECLRARALLLAGDSVAALAALARAKELGPADPERIATELECLALLDRLPSALEGLAHAFETLGPSPSLFRAQGVIELRRQGHGERALEALERARAGDPGLPFVARPLAQAHLLVGRACLDQRPAEATAHAMAAKNLVTSEDTVRDEALELEAEGLAGELRFEEALARYEALERRGADHRSTRATLHQRCATRFLLERERTSALDHYLAARRLGLSDDGLGFGADLLREEGRAALQRGLAASKGEDWDTALSALERARELVPADPDLENHLGLVHFQRAEYRAAAETWEGALALAARAGRTFEDPLPLDLAKAWRLAGVPDRAREVLARLIDQDPEGPWSGEARELLLALEAEALAGR